MGKRVKPLVAKVCPKSEKQNYGNAKETRQARFRLHWRRHSQRKLLGEKGATLEPKSFSCERFGKFWTNRKELTPTLAAVDFRYEKSQKFGFFRKLQGNEAVCSKSRNEPQIFGRIHFLFFLPAFWFFGKNEGKNSCRAPSEARGEATIHITKFDKLRNVDPGRVELPTPPCHGGILPLDYGPMVPRTNI